MALMITEDCTGCDACVIECPNEAITVGEPIYVIDPFRCTECIGAHDVPNCQPVCEPECIVPHPDFVESPEELQQKYEALHS
jgi:ferredoxin